jgi:hypothetical protein
MTTDRTAQAPSTLLRLTATALATLTLLTTLGTLLRRYGPGNMWLGFLVGAGITVLAGGIAVWRAWKRPESATSAERTVAQRADERDRAIQQRAFAVAGAITIPLTALAAIAIAVGVDTAPVLAILLWSQLVILALAYLRASRTM